MGSLLRQRSPPSRFGITQADRFPIRKVPLYAHSVCAAIDAKPLVLNNEVMSNAAIQIDSLTKDYPFGFLHLKTKRSLEGLTMRV